MARRQSSNKNQSRNHRSPKWGWWFGGFLIIAVYVFVFYYFFVGPTGFRWRALYGDQKYPEGYDIHGIDISHYQGTIDWPALRDATINDCPVRFIITKATEGQSLTDDNFQDNFYQTREHGFIRGAYHFWNAKVSARKQADLFIKEVPLEKGDLPPILDVENKPTTISLEKFQASILEWLDIMEKRYHTKPIIYTYYKFKEKYLSDSRFDKYPYWIAHYYVDKVEYKGEWKFWQHTDNGHIPGISGTVDFDIYNGSFYDLQQLCIKEIE